MSWFKGKKDLPVQVSKAVDEVESEPVAPKYTVNDLVWVRAADLEWESPDKHTNLVYQALVIDVHPKNKSFRYILFEDFEAKSYVLTEWDIIGKVTEEV